MPILTQTDRDFFDANGYMVVPGLVPRDMCQAVIDAMHDFVGGPERERWYKPPFSDWGGLEMYQHPSMWAIRQYPPVHQVYAELHGTNRLWVNLDRVSYKLPRHPDHPAYQHDGFMHWDVDVRQAAAGRTAFGVQGVLYLCDTAANQGAFQCIPGIHKRLAAFIRAQPDDFNGVNSDFAGEKFTAIPAEAGSLVIWNRNLAHGNAANTSDKPRLAMYLAMNPPSDAAFTKRQARIDAFNRREPGPGFRDQGYHWEQQRMLPVELTDLGRRVLGMDDWPADEAIEQAAR